jgi:TonB-linked SusC/RagA family outer membrane protein
MSKLLQTHSRSYTGVFRWLLIITILVQTPVLSFGQSAVSGTVVSQEDGNPLPGVNIVIKNSSVGTTTDADGKYTLAVPNDATLVFSFIGFATTEVPVGGRQTIDISLSGDTRTLDEVVVTGYSTTRKKDITGSVAIVEVDNMQRVPSPSAEQALQGMASGVNVTRSGVPGAGAKIFIRGVTNFGNTDPLVIVDGIQQDLNNISPQDIESIQVLKDAGSAAIYGVRGANGVIVVTTKKGKTGAPVVNYGATYRMAYPLGGNPFNLANTKEYVEIYNKAFPGNDRFSAGMPDYMYRGPSGAGMAFEGDPEVDPSLYFYESPNKGRNYIIQKLNQDGTDWFHDLFKKAPTLDQNLNISGGTDKSKYMFGLGYIDQQGTLLNTYLKRYSGRVNTSFTLADRIHIGENVNIIFRESPGFSENTDFGGITEVIKQQPFVPLKDIMGNWGGTFGGPGLGDGQNPVAVQTRNVPKDIVNQWYMIGNVYADVDFLKHFNVRTSLGYNVHNDYNQNFSTTQVENVQGNNTANSLSVGAGYGSQRTFTNLLTYENTFGKHYFKMLVGSEAIDELNRSVDASRQNFFSEDFNFLVLNNGTEALANSSGISSRSLFSLFSRIDYSFRDRYLLGLTVRRDGSSVFGPEQRYGVFPSVSAAWRLSEESFMQGIGWLDDLKIRGSYGVLGSQNNVSAINSYSLYGSGMTTTYYDITGSSNSIVQGFAINRIGNPATGWEENVVTNFGFDMAMFNGSLELSAEYYKKAINGLLFTEPLPAVIIGGASAPSVNIGDIQNTGLDASVKYRGNISDFRYALGVNVTTYNNKVVDIPDPGYFDSGSHQGVGAMVRNEEGHPVGSFYGYQIVGLFNSQEEVDNAPTQTAAAPGRFRYEDINNDGLIDAKDRTHLGDPNPKLTYGINLNIGYGNFDLSAFFFGSQGNEIFNLTKSYTHFMGFYPTTNVSRDLLNAWTPENTNTNIPIVESQGGFSTTTVPNSFYIENGSFLKMRSLSLGYTVPSAVLQKAKISNLRLFIQGENLFTLTKYSGLDPEIIGGSTSALGIDRGSYPNNERGLLFGLNVTF